MRTGKSNPVIVWKMSDASEAWDNFSERVIAAGLIPRNCGQGHWRIEGGLNEVNYYPFSRKKTLYVNNTTSKASVSNGSLERAIAVANDPGALPKVAPEDKVKRFNMKQLRRSMMKHRPFCHWCQADLSQTPSAATVDHVIPLARGGTNDRKNLVLACYTCNQERGHGTTWQPEEERV